MFGWPRVRLESQILQTLACFLIELNRTPPPPSLSDRTHHHQNTRHGNLSGVAARQERVGTKEVVWGPLVVHTGDEKMSHDEGDVSEASGCHAFD